MLNSVIPQMHTRQIRPKRLILWPTSPPPGRDTPARAEAQMSRGTQFEFAPWILVESLCPPLPSLFLIEGKEDDGDFNTVSNEGWAAC